MSSNINNNNNHHHKNDTTKGKTKDKGKPKVNLKIEALGGLAAGVIGTVIGYPLDLVKTRMQTASAITTTATSSAAAAAAVTTNNNNLFQVGYNILRKEGVASLYKGMVPPLISLTILNTMTFTSYNYIRTQYNAKRGFDIKNALAGISIAPMASIISTVEHMVKTQMQLDNINDKKFKNSFHCMKMLVRDYGGGSLNVLYLGHGINTAREGVFIGTYFYTYEGMRVQLDKLFSSSGGSISSNTGSTSIDYKAPAWTIPFAGGLSGAFAWFVSFPLDCIKAGVQGQSLSTTANTNKLKGVTTVYRELMKQKGWRGLYAGVTPSIMRAFIVSSSRFTAYELVVSLCSTNDDYI